MTSPRVYDGEVLPMLLVAVITIDFYAHEVFIREVFTLLCRIRNETDRKRVSVIVMGGHKKYHSAWMVVIIFCQVSEVQSTASELIRLSDDRTLEDDDPQPSLPQASVREYSLLHRCNKRLRF